MATKTIVSSQNDRKIKFAQHIRDNLLNSEDPQGAIVAIDCDEIKLPNQPFGVESTFRCAKQRLNFIKKKYNNDSNNLYISLESGIYLEDPNNNIVNINSIADLKGLDLSKLVAKDFCACIIEYKGIMASGISRSIAFDIKYIGKLRDLYRGLILNGKIYGFEATAGNLMANDDAKLDGKNWMLGLHNVDRLDQMKTNTVLTHYKNNVAKLEHLKNSYVVYKNFPKDGVDFQDVFCITKDAQLLKIIIDIIYEKYKYDDIDYIVGLESKGFCIGTPVAYLLGVGFIPIRKEGKLPGNCVKFKFNKEYGSDVFEMQTDIDPHSKLLVIDDLVALGGSINASHILIDQVACDIVDTVVIREVKGLLAHPKLEGKISILIKE
jgi:adenine phosphoribosyltransferase